MEVFSYQSAKNVRFGITVFIYFTSIIAISGYVAYVSWSAFLAFFVIAVLLVPLFFYKNFISVFDEQITLNQNSFNIKSKCIDVDYSNVKWYKVEESGNLFDVFKLKTNNGKTISIVRYKKEQTIDEWQTFKSKLISLIEKNSVNVRNYYDAPIWNYVVYFIVLIWIALPITFIIIKIDRLKAIASMLVFIGSSIPLIITIKNNQNRNKK